MLKWTVQRPRSAFSAANVRAAKATAPRRPPASTGRAGFEEDLAARSGNQGAAGPRGDGRARRSVGGGEDARGFVKASWVAAPLGNTVDENVELIDSPLRSFSDFYSDPFPEFLLPLWTTRDPRNCEFPEETNNPLV